MDSPEENSVLRFLFNLEMSVVSDCSNALKVSVIIRIIRYEPYYLARLTAQWVGLRELFANLECDGVGLDENFEGNVPGEALSGDLQPGTGVGHNLPGDQRNVPLRQELLQVVALLVLVTARQKLSHGLLLDCD